MDKKTGRPNNSETQFSEQVATKAKRKIKAQRSVVADTWFGLGMMGLIGWSVAIPTLLGAALGLWLDNRGEGQHAWTLALLIAGLTLGCFNAWHWIDKEDKAIHRDSRDDQD